LGLFCFYSSLRISFGLRKEAPCGRANQNERINQSWIRMCLVRRR